MRSTFDVATVCLLLFLMTGAVNAKPQIVAWEWPTTDCDGLVILQADLIASDLIYSTSPMPMPSDSAGNCATDPDPDAPATATSVSVTITDTSMLLNLRPGKTYYARMRVSAYVVGNWSAWSDELQFTVPYGRPNRVILSDGWFQWEAELITDPVIRFKKNRGQT